MAHDSFDIDRPLSAEESETLVAWRRQLHAQPELSLCEFDTQAAVRTALVSMGYQPIAVGGTGLAVSVGTGSGPALLLRADMDALPIQEATGLPFASQRPGAMHACGHDAHTACLLAVARRCKQHETQLPGRLVLAFQPAEENGRGALAMIDAGLLDGRWCGDPTLQVAAALGLHVWSSQGVGTVSAVAGPIMATVDEFKLVVRGRGGHGALPHQAADAVVAAAAVIQALQTIVSRQTDPLLPIVVTVGSIHGGMAFNVIAETVELCGTVRSFDRALADRLPTLLPQVAADAAKAYGATVSANYQRNTIVLNNDPTLADLVATAAGRCNQVLHVDRQMRMMGGEDFAYFAQAVPACFFFVGCGLPNGTSEPHHSPRFVIDEAALPIGAEVMLNSALAWLETAPRSGSA